MKRMFGMMPSREVQKEQSFKDQHGHTVTIQAGPNGWAVLWANLGANGKDVVASVEVNFHAGLTLVKSMGFTLTPVATRRDEA